MTPPEYSTTLAEPLTTDALVQARVEQMIGRACRRQLWFLFLDENDVQLPLIIPISDPPSRPYASVDGLAGLVSDAMREVGAHSVIGVIERYTDSALTKGDREWALAIHTAFRSADLSVRALLISHRRGVRWLATEDYLMP